MNVSNPNTKMPLKDGIKCALKMVGTSGREGIVLGIKERGAAEANTLTNDVYTL